jgi:Spy/CpxP family protein refolding chaperone
MDKAFSGDSIDDKAVRQLAEKIAGVKGDLFVQDVESRLTIGKILSADQMDKLKHPIQEGGMPGNPSPRIILLKVG